MSEPYIIWDPAVPPPAVATIQDLPRVTHVALHQAVAGDYQFLHEASLAAHEGILYAAWANDPEGELSPGGTCRGRRSVDGGLHWSEVEVIAGELPGDERHNHGELYSDGQQLHAFVARYGLGEGFLAGAVTELHTLRPEGWVNRGTVAPGIWPFTKPTPTGTGELLMLGVNQHTYPVAALSQGDLTRWEVVPIPAPEGLIFVEPGLLVYDDELVALLRYEPTDAARREARSKVALASVSRDGGRSWSLAQESNLPLAMSKVYAGRLSTGQHYVVGNLDSRDLLYIAVSRPGERLFSRAWSIRRGRSPEPRTAGYCKTPQWSYPSAIEHEDNLCVAYSVGKEDCALSIIPLEALKA
ncbi:MAG: exo-alpha-sialidase [Armatimonadetes bacterium]|nr:exo-alpha-sialidase [Armatimonadota bacterium]